jgi:hypothetical protein
MMNRVVRLLVASFITLSSVSLAWGADDNGSLSEWIKEMPATIDGVMIYRPVEDNGLLQISDIVDLPGLSRETIFVNAMLDIFSNLDSEIETVEKKDYDGMRFCIVRSTPDDEHAATYNYTIAVQTTNDMLTFLVTDISIGYKEKGLIPRTLAIEKMKPYKNARHKELIEQCAVSISKYISRLKLAVISQGKPSVSHWADIRNGQIVKGMNQTEVMLVKGKPTSNRTSNSRVKWMYGNDNVVIFTDGKVTNIIQ